MENHIKLGVAKNPPLEVALAPTTAEVDAAAATALKAAGYAHVNMTTMKALSALGLAIQGNGVVLTQHGDAYLTQDTLRNTMDGLQKAFNEVLAKSRGVPGAKKIEALSKLSESIARIARVRTQSHAAVLDSTTGISDGSGNTPPPAPNKAFEPGKPVIPAGTQVLVQSGGTVNLNQPPAESKPPTS